MGFVSLRVKFRTCIMWKTLFSLFFIGFWFPSSATDRGKFTELKRISSPDDGEGRLMRLRTCREKFTVQCKLCEVIRIVNASYAANRVHERNENDGCSDVSFNEEFDCLQSVSQQYSKQITESCNGTQSCGLVRREERLNCDSLTRISSCCVEIYYTCERRKDINVSSLFRASDSSGNTYVSLQCESSDLVVDSVLLAFNSSAEFHGVGVCYKMSPNAEYVRKRCENIGCSDVVVSGVVGCGADKYTINFGVYIYYICKDGDRVQQILKLTTLFSATTISDKQQNMSRRDKTRTEPTFVSKWTAFGHGPAVEPKISSEDETKTSAQTSAVTEPADNSEKHVNLWVNFSTLIVGVILMSVGIGCIVYTKRNRNQPADSSCLRKVTQGQIPETNNGNRGFEELEDYSYPYLPIVCVQKDIAGTCLDNRASSSKAAPEEGEIKAQCKPSWSNEVKEQTEGVATVGEVSPGVMYENVDEANKSNHLGLNFKYGADIHPRSHLEFVDVDDMVEKDSKVVYSEQEDFRNKFKSFCVPHESSTFSANSSISREDMNEVYDKLNHADQNLNPVYDQLSFSSRNKNPVYDG